MHVTLRSTQKYINDAPAVMFLIGFALEYDMYIDEGTHKHVLHTELQIQVTSCLLESSTLRNTSVLRCTNFLKISPYVSYLHTLTGVLFVLHM